jgi:hypothetical protein
LSISVQGSTSLRAQWTTPIRDGGVSIEKYRLEFSQNSTFPSFTAVDLPVVSEVQTIIAASDTIIETQAVRVLADVTNERQIVRSTVNGTDEVQTITTHCDDVTAEVQRITTKATDANELQELEFYGTKVDEVQLLRSDVAESEMLPEIQVVDISTVATREEQVIGLIIQNIDTSS